VISSGGKTARPPGALCIGESVEAPLTESSPPSAHVLGAHVQPGGDLDVRVSLGGVEDELGALDISMRRLLQRGDPFELAALLIAERDLSGLSRHRPLDSARSWELLP